MKLFKINKERFASHVGSVSMWLYVIVSYPGQSPSLSVSMAIMFMKTAVIIFLLSQILNVSASGRHSKSKTAKKYTNAKVSRISPKATGAVQPDSPKTITMKLRPKKTSPLGVSDLTLSSGSVSASTSSIGTPFEAANAPKNDVKLVHFVDEDIDGFDFDLLGFHEEEAMQSAKPVMDALIEAISAGDLPSVHNLLAKEVDLNSFEKGPMTPFMLALQTRNSEIVEAMLSTGKIDPNVMSVDGCDVLSLAGFHFGFELVDKILSGPVQVSANTAFKILSNLKELDSPIFYQMIGAMAKTRLLTLMSALVVMTKDAVLANDVNLVGFMYSVGVPLNRSYRGVYFIHFAANRGYADMVNLLIECGTPVDILTHSTKSSALQSSLSGNEHAVTVLLIKKGATHGLTGCIFDAIVNNKLPIIEALVSTYSNLTGLINFENGFNPITLAIAADKPQILHIILESGIINPLMTDSFGNSIYNMEINENASQELKTIVQKEREFANDIIDTIDFI